MRSPGFTVSLPEYGETIETLWQTVRGAYHFVHVRKQNPSDATIGFMEQNPDLIAPNNGLGFISDDSGLTYNRCHCMSYPLCPFLFRH
jgi:alpha 1,2-mannosyltransferase